MSIVPVHLFTAYVFVTVVAFLEAVPINGDQLQNYIRDDYTSAAGKYNPDTDLPTDALIRKYGYPSEAHVVSTDDDYILTLHRIPGGSNSHPVLVMHGMLASSADWIVSGPNKGLGYILADAGYDVWLGNFRGNTYSRVHRTLSPKSTKFWDFSWHEMGVYDLPAMISYITDARGSNVSYIGHSMGTTSFYVMATQRPDIASKVQMMFSLAPVAYMDLLISPVRFLAPLANQLQLLSVILGKGELLSQSKLIKFFAKYGCDHTSLGMKICSNLVFLISGCDKPQLNTTLLPVILGHTPAGTSSKAGVHYLQEIKSKKFRQFDYGRRRNSIIYNSPEPPDYDLSQIRVPIALYYADNDWLANTRNVFQLSRELPNVVDIYNIPYKAFNHVDFMWAIQAPEFVYERIIRTLREMLRK